MTKRLERQRVVWQGVACEYRLSSKPHCGVYIWCGEVRGRVHPKHGQSVLASVRAWVEEFNRGNAIHLPAIEKSGYCHIAHKGKIYSYKVTSVSGNTKRVAVKRFGAKGRGKGNKHLVRLYVTNEDAATAVSRWLGKV